MGGGGDDGRKREKRDDRGEVERENKNPDGESQGREVGWVGRPLDWSDPTALPWQQYGRALLLFQATWGPKHVCRVRVSMSA